VILLWPLGATEPRRVSLAGRRGQVRVHVQPQRRVFVKVVRPGEHASQPETHVDPLAPYPKYFLPPNLLTPYTRQCSSDSILTGTKLTASRGSLVPRLPGFRAYQFGIWTQP
jgi:hypothetical protein